ncbi:MAG: 3-oxoacyl-ACP reductase family protein [Chloroflexota bacterium]|nr:3-oxoacyl-ACP reductase family protein [Chloroflexota bacterium]
MTTGLSGKVALVTGSSQGIGAGAALSLARGGVDVAVNYLRAAELAQEVCEQIRALGRQAHVIQADVTDAEAVRHMVAEVEQTIGPIDILVNNAGHNPARTILEISEADWDWVLDLNLKAYFLCTKAVLPGMLERKEGRIINITSISGQRGGFSCDVDYSAAKAGIMGFTRALARWAAPRGILVNAIAPGYIETQMQGGVISPHLASLIDRVPLKRQGTPEEIGEVVAFLAGPAATYIVGEVISVNGGAHIA